MSFDMQAPFNFHHDEETGYPITPYTHPSQFVPPPKAEATDDLLSVIIV